MEQGEEVLKTAEKLAVLGYLDSLHTMIDIKDRGRLCNRVLKLSEYSNKEREKIQCGRLAKELLPAVYAGIALVQNFEKKVQWHQTKISITTYISFFSMLLEKLEFYDLMEICLDIVDYFNRVEVDRVEEYVEAEKAYKIWEELMKEET